MELPAELTTAIAQAIQLALAQQAQAATITEAPKATPAPTPVPTPIVPTRAPPCYTCECCWGTVRTCACCGYAVERECDNCTEWCQDLGADCLVHPIAFGSLCEKHVDQPCAQACNCKTYTPFCRYTCHAVCSPLTLLGYLFQCIGKSCVFCCFCASHRCWLNRILGI